MLALASVSACQRAEQGADLERMAALEERVTALESRLAELPAGEGELESAGVDELVERLDSPDLVARYRAASELEERGEDVRIDLLLRLEDGTKRQRRSAAAVLAHAATESDLQGLLALREEMDDATTLALLDLALGRTDSDLAVEPLLDDLTHPSRRVRAAAVEALDRLGRPRSAPALLWLVLSDDSRVGPMAREAVQRLGSPALLFVEDEWDAYGPRQREAVLDILGSLEGDEIERFLADRLSDASALVALKAAEELARRGDPGGTLLARSRLGSDDPVIARRARDVLDAHDAALERSLEQ